MTKVIEIVRSSLRKIRVIDSDSSPDPSMVADAIGCMNRMLMRWQANGTQLGFSPVTGADEVIAIPIEAEQAVIYNLALDLGSEFGVAPGQDIVNLALGYMREVIRDQFVSMPLRANGGGAPLPESTCGSHYDVLTDGYH